MSARCKKLSSAGKFVSAKLADFITGKSLKSGNQGNIVLDSETDV